MNTLERLAAIVAELLRDDVRRVLLGEDVRQGGMLGLSRAAMRDPALGLRVLATPLTPAACLAHATGLALAGRRPIVLLPSATAMLEGYAALRELGRIGATSAGERSAPVLIVAPTGPGFGLGGDGADSPDGAIAAIPGLRVAILGDAREAGAMLRCAANFEDGEGPTVLLLPRALLLREVEDEEVVETLGRPLCAARVVREGTAATVFAWGAAVDLACAAVEQSGHDASVVELGGLSPLDVETVVAAAAQTGKLVIAHAGGMSFGPGAELAALLADRAILHLDAPIVRVCGRAGPLAYPEEMAGLPDVAAIAAAIHQVVTY
ncbi:MAG TPA: transketolase C-terminal domain-containing protein [Nannocystis sp.]